MSITKKNESQQKETILVHTHNQLTEDFILEPYLVILSGLDQGKQFLLDRQFNTVGRTDTTDIKISDTKISRKHGVIIVYPDKIIFKDKHSTNGSFVNNNRIEQEIINPETRIQLGSTLMKIEYKNTAEAELEMKLYNAANTDALTNILNRRAFMIRAHEEVSFCKRNNSKLALVMCDIDHFKHTNDNFGHPAGDMVLKELANVLLSQIRKEDMLARFGGEEFIMLLRSTDIDSISQWAERIRKKIEHFPFNFQGNAIPTTLSIGICSVKGDKVTSLDALIKKADDALYQAKNNGRNQVKIC